MRWCLSLRHFGEDRPRYLCTAKHRIFCTAKLRLLYYHLFQQCIRWLSIALRMRLSSSLHDPLVSAKHYLCGTHTLRAVMSITHRCAIRLVSRTLLKPFLGVHRLLKLWHCLWRQSWYDNIENVSYRNISNQILLRMDCICHFHVYEKHSKIERLL